MARKPRIHFPGAVYHVMLRGNGGNDIFFSAMDRSKMSLLLQEGVERYGHRIHAFCFMTNHVHLAIQVGDVPLSKIIQNVSFRYTRYSNAVRKTSGHLFQGRYKAILIDADRYLIQLVRYIHNNPVRAGMAVQCGKYRWSSHCVYSGETDISWLTTEWVLGQFSDQLESAQHQYEEFVSDGQDEKRRTDFHQGSKDGQLLGDDEFLKKVLAPVAVKNVTPRTLDQIINAVCSVYEKPFAEIKAVGQKHDNAEARATLAFLVQSTQDLSLTKLAEVLGRDLSGISRAAGRLRIRLQNDNALQGRMEKIKNKLFA